MILQIPGEATTATSVVQETSLDGTVYRLLFRWNEREGVWYLTIRDLEDTVLAPGLKLVCGVLLYRHHLDSRLPPGQMLVINTANPGVDPGRDDFANESAVLLYGDEEEVATPTAGTAVEVGGFNVLGEMQISASAATAVTTTPKKAAGTYIQGILDGFSFADGRLIYTGSQPVNLIVTVAAVAESDSSIELEMSLYKNGLPLPNVSMDFNITAALGKQPINLSAAANLEPNEFLELFLTGDGSASVTLSKAVVTAAG